MSRSLNKATIIRNLTRDPELRYTPAGTAVCTFGVATNSTWTTSDGEKKESVEFHNIVAWTGLAEVCGQYLRKGSKVYLEGRIQSRKWTGKDDVERTTVEITINEMIMLDSRGGGATPPAGGDSFNISAEAVDKGVDDQTPPTPTDGPKSFKKPANKPASSTPPAGAAKQASKKSTKPNDDIPF